MNNTNNTKKNRFNLPLLGIGIIFLVLIALFIASRSFGAFGANGKTSAAQIGSARDAADFLAKYGWEVDYAQSSVKTVRIPDEFTPVYEEYNRLQKSQGFDLTDYRSKNAVMYTFRVLNYPSSEDKPRGGVFGNVLTCDGAVIAGDLVSYALDGFLVGLNG